MSPAVYGQADPLVGDEDSKMEKQNEGEYNSQANTAQQSHGSHQLPSIFSVIPGNHSPQAKNEDSALALGSSSVQTQAQAQAQALSYFNYPVYHQAPTRRETELSVPYYGACLPGSSNPVSQQITSSYLPSNISPQSSFSGISSQSPLYIPLTAKPVARKVQRSRVEKCMCRRVENHIPRPRNAFILFRQKYHQSVLKEHVHLKTNPEVSRELARRWRSLAKEEKDHWNQLAEEEKQNHAKKYPNYRYKPRRNKNSGPCPVCQVKTLERPPTPRHNFASLQDYQPLSMAPDIKMLKSPLVSVNQPSIQYQQGSSYVQSPYGQHQQHQTQVQQQSDACGLQRYPPYGSYHLQNQYSFGEGHVNYAGNGQHQQASTSTSSTSILQNQNQQQYFPSAQQRGSQPSLSQSSSRSQSQSQVDQSNHTPQNQPQLSQQGTEDTQLQHSIPNPSQAHNYSVSSGQSSQSLTAGQFQSYADKYHETPAPGYQCPDSAEQPQKYSSLPTPLATSLYSSTESYPVTASLASY